jgi:transposase InsO family protein
MVQSRFEINNGIIYYRHDTFCRIFVPKFNTSNMLQGSTASSHSCLLHMSHQGIGPHLGEEATLNNLIHDYWWPQIKTDVQKFVGSCITCGMEKTAKLPATGVLSSTSLPAYRPFGFVMIDHMELSSAKLNVLLIVCCYSAYCIAVPVKSESASDTIEALYYNLFMVHGVPERIHSDRGTAYTAALTQELFTLSKISHTLSISRHPQAQGFVENRVKTIKQAVKTALSKRKDIPATRALISATAVYNFKRDGPYGWSPYEIAFSRAPNSIQNLILPPQEREHIRPNNDWITSNVSLLHSLVNSERIQRLQEISDRYLLSAHPTKLKIGDFVLLALPTVAPGGYNYTVSGPYIIINKPSRSVYDISEEVWEFDRPIDSQAKTQRRSELQLRRMDHPEGVRDGLPRDPNLPTRGTLQTQAKPRGRPPKARV